MTPPAPSTPASPPVLQRAFRVDIPLRWRPSLLAGRLATVAVLSAVAGLLVTQVEMLVIAAPFLLALVVASRPERHRLTVRAEVTPTRCIEGDEVTVTVVVAEAESFAGLRLTLAVDESAWQLEDAPSRTLGGTAPACATWTLVARRWGRRTVGPLRVEAHASARLRSASADVDLRRVDVLPPVALAQRLPLPPRLLERVGLHAGRSPGAGVEFAGVRAYEPGDVVRRVNWPATARRGRLHLTRHAAERSADVVVVIDATTDVADTLDLAVRGAAGITQAYLRAGDRVGVVALGGMLRWLPPGVGARQLYRMAEAVLDVRLDDSYVVPDLSRLPRASLPPGALVFALSPLLDATVLEVLRDLRERGHPTVIVDLLRADPAPPEGTRAGREAVRLWRLEREALRHELASIGAVVVPWGDSDDAIGMLDRVALRLDPRGTPR